MEQGQSISATTLTELDKIREALANECTFTLAREPNKRYEITSILNNGECACFDVTNFVRIPDTIFLSEHEIHSLAVLCH